jgi:mono/diheme cytochrome c family protein
MVGMPSPRYRHVHLLLPLAALVIAGCGQGKYPEDLEYPPRTDLLVITAPTAEVMNPIPPGDLDAYIASLQDEPGTNIQDPMDVNADDRSTLADLLKDRFGTPAKPTVTTQVADAVETLKLDDKTLAKGSELYRRHCLTCHGLTGDGRGPTGPWVNPNPRDYRQGVFKFKSTRAPKPRREDLLRTIRMGIDGTSMPSHILLPEDELEALVSYVIHLSIRGEVEYTVLRQILEGNDSGVEELVEFVTDQVVIPPWVQAEQGGPIEVRPYPEKYLNDPQEFNKSVERGYKLFTDTKGATSCIACHIDFGRRVPFRHDTWGTLARPANLTAGIYRGGRRPVDIYRRVAVGITLGKAQMPPAELEGDQYWDLVNFVLTLPHPHQLPEDIRTNIYGPMNPERTEHASR